MKNILLLIAVLAVSVVFCAEPASRHGGFAITCVPESHFAEIGDKIEFTVKSDTKTACNIVLTLDGGKVLKSLKGVTAPQTLTYIPDKAGFIRCSVKARNVNANCAVAVSPEKIVVFGKEPADYDVFWKNTFEESAKLPLDMQVTKLEYPGDFDYYRLSCANINGKRAYGLYAVPKKIDKPVPLVLHFGGGEAFCYDDSLRYFSRCCSESLKRKVAVLMFHLPPYQPGANGNDAKLQHQAFLKELSGNPRRYITWKETLVNKESFYARSAVVGCLRLLDYVAQSKEIDSENIVFRGASHGGKFGAYLCCFSNRIKAAFCGVPSSCEFQAHLDNRRSSTVREWKNHLDIINYYDLVWCAGRIKCPILVSVGFVDDSCPPTGVYAFYNELKYDKKIYNKVDYGHGGAPKDYEEVVWKFLSDNIEK